LILYPQLIMFNFNNLKIQFHKEVYEPSEDTFQLIESIKVKKGENIFEIGTGTGIISLECCRKGANVLCSDINPYAVDLTKNNYENNKEYLIGCFEIRQGDLFTVLESNESFNKIIFNPPYLPTKPEERIGESGWFDKAVDGGIDGLKIIEKFIEGLSKHLSKKGFVYFVFSSLPDRDKLEKIIIKNNFNFKIVNSNRYDGEIIDIYCLFF